MPVTTTWVGNPWLYAGFAGIVVAAILLIAIVGVWDDSINTWLTIALASACVAIVVGGAIGLWNWNRWDCVHGRGGPRPVFCHVYR